MLLAPNGTGKVTVHGTPSDVRALRNTISGLRRQGEFEWPPKRGDEEEKRHGQTVVHGHHVDRTPAGTQ